MNRDTAMILKILGITIAIVIVSGLFIGSDSNDFHIHDTYFVMNAITQIILITLSALFVIGLIASVWTKFQNKLFVKILVFSTFLLISFGMYLFSSLVKVN